MKDAFVICERKIAQTLWVADSGARLRSRKPTNCAYCFAARCCGVHANAASSQSCALPWSTKVE